MNIATRTTIVSNVQLDKNIRIWLLEEKGFNSAPETWKCRRRNNVFGHLFLTASNSQDAQLSQKDRAAGCVSSGQKWKTGTGRQYFMDIIGLSLTTVT